MNTRRGIKRELSLAEDVDKVADNSDSIGTRANKSLAAASTRIHTRRDFKTESVKSDEPSSGVQQPVFINGDDNVKRPILKGKLKTNIKLETPALKGIIIEDIVEDLHVYNYDLNIKSINAFGGNWWKKYWQRERLCEDQRGEVVDQQVARVKG